MMAIDSDEHMLTTVDNPWNPFTNYDEWYSFDRDMGYDTPGFLARVSKVSLDLSSPDVELSIEQAIDDICSQNVSGLYVKAERPSTTTTS
jgi:hypothetical protein